jgi:hypothetical protein
MHGMMLWSPGLSMADCLYLWWDSIFPEKIKKNSHSKINLILSYLHRSAVIMGGKNGGMWTGVRRFVCRVTYGAG